MTLGERIAGLRKEKGLSQEALGELVGVTRQAVSKWEADKALPDVNNCVAMSKVFEISLPQLLDLEEETMESPPTDLNEQQLRMVERMTERYTEAQQRIRRRWRWPAILLACVLLVGAAWLWEWLDAMNRRVDYLSGEMAGMQGEIISGVGNEVRETMEEERSLITQYNAEVVSADVLEETVTFAVSVTLKEGGADTIVSFVSRGGDTLEIVPAEHQGGLYYTAEVTCPIMDNPPIDLLVEQDGVSRSQPLSTESYESDYAIRLGGDVRWAALLQSGLAADAIEAVDVFAFLDPGKGLEKPLELIALEIGLFRNEKLTETLPLDVSAGNRGALNDWSFHQEVDIPIAKGIVDAGDTLTFVLLAEDNYGRKASCIISRYKVLEDSSLDDLTHEKLQLDDGTFGTEVWR